MKVILLFTLLFVSLAFAAWEIQSRKTKEAYWLYGFCLLLFSALYGVTFLNLKVGGSTLTLEQQKQVEEARKDVITKRDEVDRLASEVAKTQMHVEKLAAELLKTSAVILDGEGRFGGMPESHKNEIQKHMAAIETLLSPNDPNLKNEIRKMIQAVNLQKP